MEDSGLKNRDVSLLDILDAVLEKGVVIRGDLTISIADIDLVYLDLRVLLASVDTLKTSKHESTTDGNEKVLQARREKIG
ncbi:gas vesicle protein [Alteribacillus sp. HJP-4]|uniref:gas vesicle protein n=1 Tax=Alteribacillus sp. HJP-4 TaxID=2775394 RepID=UPI0035CD2A0C